MTWLFLPTLCGGLLFAYDNPCAQGRVTVVGLGFDRTPLFLVPITYKFSEVDGTVDTVQSGMSSDFT